MRLVEGSARGKINLQLHILGRRKDGYHDLDTVFQEIDLADTLRWQPGQPPLTISMIGRGETLASAENLCWRMGELFGELEGVKPGGSLQIEKRIPLGGGLGGGSADAVAFLRLLWDVHGRQCSWQRWQDASLQMGADLPFFLEGGCQRGLGRGEKLTPFAPPIQVPRQGHLFLPPFALSTAAVFGQVEARDYQDAPSCRIFDNHLLPAAFRVHPAFADLFATLDDLCDGPFFMTGSGSTCVWLHESQTEPTPELLHVCAISQVEVLPFAFHDHVIGVKPCI
jgi:4-diphosphocytidyl-2-C-methyl-D-erythritol kinase